jgi:hypothetical protein
MLARRVGRRIAGLRQHSVDLHRSQWVATVQSGSTTLSKQHSQTGSYSMTAVQRQHYGPLFYRRYNAKLLTECSVVGGKTRRAHAVKEIICYS